MAYNRYTIASARYEEGEGGVVPKLKPEELETRRREIIDGARECFLRSGFHQTTTDEICRAASITPGGLYHYFSSKEEIISAVIQQNARTTVETLRQMIEGSDDARSAFREVIQFVMQFIQDPDVDNVTRLDIEIWAETLKNEKLAEINRGSWALRRQWMETLIRRGMAEGVYNVRDLDVKAFANLMLATVVGMRIGKLLWKDDFDADSAMHALYLLNTGRLAANLDAVAAGAQ